MIDKEQIFRTMENRLLENGFRIISRDETRPWGGFFVIDETQSSEFIDSFFPELNKNDFLGKISPKILIVLPGKRLSWQYHFRRAECWKVIEGEVGVAVSETDDENPAQSFLPGSMIRLKKGERHRLIGLDNIGIIAEIWQHTDNEKPSDEDDIVRVQDDFGR